jgi:hypothetical protein
VALSRSASYTLACTGPGGRIEASTTITVTAAPVSPPASSGGGGGGGGALQWPVLMALMAWSARPRRTRVRHAAHGRT